MGWYPFSELVTAYVVLAAGLAIYAWNPHEKLYKVFAVWLFFLFFGFLFQYLTDVALGFQEARTLMVLSDFFWFLSVAFILHAVLIFSSHPYAENKPVLTLLYFVPVLTFVSSLLFTSGYETACETQFGTAIFSGTFYQLINYSLVLYVLAAVGLCLITYLRTEEINKKTQALLFGFSLFLPLSADYLAEFIASAVNLNAPTVVTPAYWLSVVLMLIAFLRYNLLPRYPEIAAETIFSYHPDLLLVADLDSRINLINESFLQFLGETGKSLRLHPLSRIIGQEAAGRISQQVFIEKKNVLGYPLPLRDRVISFNAAQVKDPTKDTIGLVLIGRDITARKKTENELFKTTEELDKNLNDIDHINKLFVDRELEIVGLKNEVAALKARSPHG